MKSIALALVVLWFAATPAARAQRDAERSPLLRSENEDVNEGNEMLAAGDAKGALAAYDRAARELPSEGGVHLNRGLALLQTGDMGAAREALRLATQPPASKAVRADAYYDLGNAFYKEADAQAGDQQHDAAQKSFQEAADAFKQALRLRAGDRNAAWNYELAVRRIREQEQKQQEQKDQEQEQKDQEQEQKDQEQEQKDQEQEQKDQEQKQDQQQEQSKDQDQEQKQDQEQEQKQQQDQTQKQDQQQPQQEEPQQAQPTPREQPREPPIPRDVERALDALEEGEDNLERLRALRRAARERRAPEKDW